MRTVCNGKTVRHLEADNETELQRPAEVQESITGSLPEQ